MGNVPFKEMTAREIVWSVREDGKEHYIPAQAWPAFKAECEAHCNASDLVAEPDYQNGIIWIKKG